MCTMKKDMQAIFVASKECGLDMNVEKTYVNVRVS